jgi:soluble lytic murein transglycosylase
VIQNESSFNPKMKGSVGEIGLMQIRPETAKWIAGLTKIKYKGEKSLYQPEMNIRIGAAFLNRLRNQFDSNSTYYLTAYNAGAGNVRKMISENVTPKIYASAVMKRYAAIYSALGTNKGSLSERADRVLASVISATSTSKN